MAPRPVGKRRTLWAWTHFCHVSTVHRIEANYTRLVVPVGIVRIRSCSINGKENPVADMLMKPLRASKPPDPSTSTILQVQHSFRT